MKILPAVDDDRAEYRSTISQFSGRPLTFYKGGQWVPLAFDSIDYVKCKCVVSHRAILSDPSDLGYYYPVTKSIYITDDYVYHDHKEIQTLPLPEWFGEGTYRKAVDEHALINSDDNSLGVRNVQKLSVGTGYAIAKKTLPPVE